MRTIAIPAAGLILAASLFGAGCAATSTPTPPKGVETSYPSPDYPPQSAATTPSASQPAASQTLPPPASAGTPPLASRPLDTTPPPTPPASAPASPMGAPGPQTRPPRGEGAPGAAMLFNAMDADRNGRVPLEEWRAFHEREFRLRDKNNDGVLSREEMTAPLPMRPGQAGGQPPVPPAQGPATAFPAQ